MATVLNRFSRVVQEVEDRDLSKFSREEWIHNPDLSSVEGLAPNFWNILGDEISPKHPTEIATLKHQKARRELGMAINRVNQATRASIEEGFVYPKGGTKTFSLSVESQVAILGAFILRNGLTYPIRWRTKDSQDYIDLGNVRDVEEFCTEAFNTLLSRREAGAVLRDSVVEEVKAKNEEEVKDKGKDKDR